MNGGARFNAAEADRRIANTVSVGTVEEADYATARLRLRIGALLTGWVPWADGRAGGNRTWSAPEIGEQMILLAPGGDIALGVAIGGIYSDAHPAPAASPEIHRIDYGDGSFIQFDRASGKLTISTTGDIDLIAGGNVKINGQRIDLN